MRLFFFGGGLVVGLKIYSLQAKNIPVWIHQVGLDKQNSSGNSKGDQKINFKAFILSEDQCLE